MSSLHLPPKPTLQDIQTYVKQMEKERGFADQTVLQPALLLVEEVGELLKCIRKSHTNMGVDVNKKYELDAASEIADIVIVVTQIANKLRIDMEQAFRDKEEKNKQRIWR